MQLLHAISILLSKDHRIVTIGVAQANKQNVIK
jgi:hypothetical protein